MGISGSKLVQKVQENTNPEEKILENGDVDEQGSIPSTPILTPKLFKENSRKDDLDPRSPSKHIARTPIELLPAAAEKLQALTLENNDNEAHKETPLKRHILLGIDPRSPSLEIQRTPIVISASPDMKFPEKIRNKNLDKVLKCALPTTPKEKITPPKLLESCPITPKPKSDVYKRKSFVLLETNVDFTETDLDRVITEKYLGKSLQNLYTPGKTSYSEISDPRSPSVDFLRTPIQICKKLDNLNTQNIQQQSEQNEDKNDDIQELHAPQHDDISVNVEKLSSTIQPEETIIQINKEGRIAEDINIIEEMNQNFTESDMQDDKETRQHQNISMVVNEAALDVFETNTEEIITLSPSKEILPTTSKQETQFTNSAPVSPPNIVSVTPKKSKSQPVTPPLIDLTADVKELDKKLTHLIYEDEDLVVCPRIVKIKEQNRTPLALRNGTDNKKPIQKLKVSDKPRKAEYAVSKIPIFKEKKIKVQCENTPPKNMRGNVHKKSQWDAKDDTLVI